MPPSNVPPPIGPAPLVPVEPEPKQPEPTTPTEPKPTTPEVPEEKSNPMDFDMTTIILGLLAASGVGAGLPFAARAVGKGVIRYLGPKLEKKLFSRLKKRFEGLNLSLPNVISGPSTPAPNYEQALPYQVPQAIPVPVPPAEPVRAPVLSGKMTYDHQHRWINAGEYPRQVVQHESQYVPVVKEDNSWERAMDRAAREFPSKVGFIETLKSIQAQEQAGN